jgi:hypothetical protein
VFGAWDILLRRPPAGDRLAGVLTDWDVLFLIPERGQAGSAPVVVSLTSSASGSPPRGAFAWGGPSSSVVEPRGCLIGGCLVIASFLVDSAGRRRRPGSVDRLAAVLGRDGPVAASAALRDRSATATPG